MIKTVLCLMVPVVFQAGQAPASRQTPPRAAASRPAGVDLRVTDRTGATLADARVAAEGAVSRSGVTDASGLVTFRNLPAGTYRLHIEHDGYVALEKEMAVAAGSTITGQAALTAAPPPPAPAPPPPPPPPAPAPTAPALAPGDPRLLSIPDFVDAQRMGREGVKTSPIGCSGATQARMIQVRDPLVAHTHADADEILYVVAGDATVKMAGKNQAVTSGWLVVVPREMEFSVTRAGRNPVILVSAIGGPPCPQSGIN